MKTKQDREDKALEAIMCVCLKADKEKWPKTRWDAFWRKVYAKIPKADKG